MALANHLTPYDVQQAQEACQAMFLLNKRVKTALRYQRRVYALKYRLIQKLYRCGYFQCLVDDGERGYLYLFVVDGVSFLWHRPEIELPVAVSLALPDMPPMPPRRYAVLTDSQINRCCKLVATWLEAVRS